MRVKELCKRTFRGKFSELYEQDDGAGDMYLREILVDGLDLVLEKGGERIRTKASDLQLPGHDFVLCPLFVSTFWFLTRSS